MTDDRTNLLVITVNKLLRRGAFKNIERILKKSHAADIAVLIDSLRLDEGFQIFKMISTVEKQAQTLSHIEEKIQKEFLTLLNKDDTLKLLDLMESDDAADLLGLLSEEESADILRSMVKEDSEEVADLMGYPEDSAGGLMSADFLPLNQMLTVEQAISAIQGEEANSQIITFYIYVINDNGHLVGVVSLKQLLLSRKNELLKNLMFSDVISVSVDTNQEQVAKIVERYDFLSIPVVDRNNTLVGVITVDDVIDVIREEAEEELLALGQAGSDADASTRQHFLARLPWLSLAFLSGSLCFAFIYLLGNEPGSSMALAKLWMAVSFLPLSLTLGATSGSQSVYVSLAALRIKDFSRWEHIGPHFLKELTVAALFALLFGVLAFILSFLIFQDFHLIQLFAPAIAIQIMVSVTLGCGLPILLSRIGFDPTVSSLPLFTAIADLTGVIVLFGLFRLLGF